MFPHPLKNECICFIGGVFFFFFFWFSSRTPSFFVCFFSPLPSSCFTNARATTRGGHHVPEKTEARGCGSGGRNMGGSGNSGFSRDDGSREECLHVPQGSLRHGGAKVHRGPADPQFQGVRPPGEGWEPVPQMADLGLQLQVIVALEGLVIESKPVGCVGLQFLPTLVGWGGWSK